MYRKSSEWPPGSDMLPAHSQPAKPPLAWLQCAPTTNGRDGQVMSLAPSSCSLRPATPTLCQCLPGPFELLELVASRRAALGPRARAIARASPPRSNLIMPLPIEHGMGWDGMGWDGPWIRRGVAALKEAVVSWCVLSAAHMEGGASPQPSYRLPSALCASIHHGNKPCSCWLDQGSCLWSRSASLPSLPRLSLPWAWMSHHLVHPGLVVGCLRLPYM